MKKFLALVSLVLTAVLALLWFDWQPQREPAPEAGIEKPAGLPSTTTEDGPLDLLTPSEVKDDYAVVIERPLFLPDRRPPSEEPEDPETELAPVADATLERLDLNAIMITPAKAIAWVRDPTQKDLQDLEFGDELNGWTVKEILADRLVLERQGVTDTLTLRDYQTSPPQAPRARPRTAARTPPPPKRPPRVAPDGQRKRPAVQRPNDSPR